MKKSYKFRIYPNKKQEKKLEQALDQACFLYNQMLDIHQQIYLGEERTLSEFDMTYLMKDFKLDRLYSQVKNNICKRISDAFKHFFRRVKNGENPGYPKFHKRIFYSSITYPQYLHEIFPNNRIYVSKIGMIKIKLHRSILGNIKTLTIKKENEEWYAIFSCDNVPEESVNNEFKSEIEGIDVGLNKFLVCSNGIEFENYKFLVNSEKRLKRIQRRLSKKKKGSKNRKKQIKKINVYHLKVKRQREDFHKKLARKLASEIKYIGIEDLNIKGMVKNHHLARSISDVGWGQFIEYLKYYKTIFEGEIIKIGRFEPTSKKCSKCGNIQDIKLSQRIFKCNNCNLELDRDLNAAINIKQLTKEIIKKNTVGQTEIKACGDIVRPKTKPKKFKSKANVEEAGNTSKQLEANHFSG